ncbi:MAG: fibronectin type III domain-containing protein [Armatimonadota bacterium]
MIASVRRPERRLQPIAARRWAILPILFTFLLLMSSGVLLAASVEVEVVNTTSNSAELSWVPVGLSDVVSYEVTYYAPGMSRTIYARLATSATITGLSPSTQYSAKVVANYASGSVYSYVYFTTEARGAPSNPGTPVTPAVPTPPTDLQVSLGSNNIAELSWNDTSSNATGFKIMRSAAANGVFTMIGSTTKGVTTFRNAGLMLSTTYYYKVCAYNAYGDSAYTDVVSISTPVAPPLAPSRLVASAVSSNQINLSWYDASSNEEGFRIERAKSANGPFAQIALAPANATSYADSGLEPSTAYYYKVYAYNEGGSAGSANTASAVTQAKALDPPTGLQAAAISSSQVQLNWHAVDGALGYRVQYASNAGGPYTAPVALGANVTAYSFSRLTPSTTYFFRVCAYNSVGNSEYSDAVAATTQAVPPIAPRLSATAVSDQQIDLSWNVVNGATSYVLERRNPANGDYEIIGTVDGSIASYSDIKLSSSTTYYYRATAANSMGSSGYSNVASATTRAKLPDVPVGLKATVVSTNQIDLSWQDVDGETGYRVQRASNENGPYYNLATTTANVTNFANYGLLPGTAYYYRVCAYSSLGTSEYCDAVEAITKSLPPAAPRSLTAKAVSASQIELQWIGVTGAEDYVIERSTSANGAFEVIGNSAAKTSFSDTGLSASTAYYYRVYATNSGGNSGYSNVANATTQTPLPELPEAPAGLTATAVSTSQINLTWNAVAGAAGYTIERAPGANGAFVKIGSTNAGVTTFANTGLTASTAYYYRVYATNAAGNSNYSNVANATTQTPLPEPPEAPAGLTATAVSTSQINLAWNAVAGATAYTIERAPGANAFAKIGNTNAGVTTFANTDLAASTTYYYRVYATNAAGNSNYSNVTNATTQTPLPELPEAPAGLTATAVSTSQINLAWNAVAGAAGYTIERAASANAAFVKIGSTNAGVTTFANTGLAASTAYYYRVYATNAAGNSNYSNVANATTQTPLPELPEAPAGLTATAVSTSQINLAWNAVAGATGYTIERAAGANAAFVKIGSTNAGVTTFANTGLAASTAYYYRVYATNAAGNSNYSNVANATTQTPLPELPEAPAGLTATAVSTSQINLAWNAVAGAAGYTIERAPGANGAFAKIGNTNAGVTTFANTDLAASTTYYYRVYATNAAGNSNYSNVADATTEKTADRSSPSGLTATAVSTKQIDLAWTGIANVIGYSVERAACADGPYTKIAFVAASSTTYCNLGLAASTTYYYRVYANTMTGTSDYSNVAHATTEAPPAPPKLPAPSELRATTITSNSVELSWNDNSTDEFGFYVERSITKDFSVKEVFACGAGRSSHSDARLSEDSTYYYRVYAYGITGNSDYSNTLEITTRMKAPTNLVGVAESPTLVVLAWSDNSDKELSYFVERREGGGTWKRLSSELPANTHSYQDQECEPARTYTYRVTAVGRSSSETSGEAAVTTPTVKEIALEWVGPVSTDHLTGVYGSFAVSASDNYLYAVSAGVVNIYSTDGAEVPKYYSHVFLTGASGVSAVVIDGEDYACITAGNTLKLIKPADPSFERSVGLPGYGYKPVCDGNLVYVACGNSGLAVVDISDPYNPALVAYPDLGLTQAWSVDAKGSIVVVANGSEGLAVLDASDPVNIKKVAMVGLTTNSGAKIDTAFDVALGKGMAWVACVYSGLCQVDVTQLYQPFWVRAIGTTGPATGVCTSGDYVFVACNNGVSVRTGIEAYGYGGGKIENLGFLQTIGYDARAIATHNRMIYLTDNWFLADVAKF